MKAMQSAVLTMLFAALVSGGCSRSSTEKAQETVTSPGGKTTTTVEKTVKSSGDNPPANSAGESVPPKNK